MTGPTARLLEITDTTPKATITCSTDTSTGQIIHTEATTSLDHRRYASAEV